MQWNRACVCVCVCVCVLGGRMHHHNILQSKSKAVMEQCFQSSRAQYPQPPIMRNTTSLALNIQKLNTTRWTCAPTLTQSTQRKHQTLLLRVFLAKLIYIMQSVTTTALLKPTLPLSKAHIIPVLELWSWRGGHATSVSWAVQLCPRYSRLIMKSFIEGGAICCINETFSAAAMTKIFKWPQANMKKQFSQTILNSANCAIWMGE